MTIIIIIIINELKIRETVEAVKTPKKKKKNPHLIR